MVSISSISASIARECEFCAVADTASFHNGVWVHLDTLLSCRAQKSQQRRAFLERQAC